MTTVEICDSCSSVNESYYVMDFTKGDILLCICEDCFVSIQTYKLPPEKQTTEQQNTTTTPWIQ